MVSARTNAFQAMLNISIAPEAMYQYLTSHLAFRWSFTCTILLSLFDLAKTLCIAPRLQS